MFSLLIVAVLEEMVVPVISWVSAWCEFWFSEVLFKRGWLETQHWSLWSVKIHFFLDLFMVENVVVVLVVDVVILLSSTLIVFVANVEVRYR